MIACSLCDFQAFSKGNLTFHLNSVHFKDKEYMCRLCHFKTAYKGALTRHVNSVHLRTGKTKECPICGYTTSSLLNLNSHLSVSHHLEIATAFARPTGAKNGVSSNNPQKVASRSQANDTQQQQQQPQQQQQDRLPRPMMHHRRQEEPPLHPLHPNPHHVTQQPVNLSLASPLLQQYNKLTPPTSTNARPTALSPINSNVVIPPPQDSLQPPPLFDCRFCEFKSTSRDEMVAHYNLEHLHLLYRELSQQRALEARKMAAAAAVNAASSASPPGDHHHSAGNTVTASPPLPMLQRPSSPSPPEREHQQHHHQQGIRLRKLTELKENADEDSPNRVHYPSMRNRHLSPPATANNRHLTNNSPSPPFRSNGNNSSPSSPPQTSSTHPQHHHPHPYLRPEALRCRLCHFQAASPAYLKNHIRTVHLEEVHTLNCPLCEYTSDKASDIDNHLDMDHMKPLPLASTAASSAIAAAAAQIAAAAAEEEKERERSRSPNNVNVSASPPPQRGSLIIID